MLSCQFEQMQKESNFKFDEVFQRLDSMPTDLRNMLVEDQFLSSNGSTGLRLEMDRQFQNVHAILSDIRNQYSHPQNVIQYTSQSARSDTTTVACFQWGGRFHPVPENFIFPTCDLQKLWDLWYFGLPSENIQGLRKLKTFDLKTASQKTLLSKAGKY
jgi:hypothetical protein